MSSSGTENRSAGGCASGIMSLVQVQEGVQGSASAQIRRRRTKMIKRETKGSSFVPAIFFNSQFDDKLCRNLNSLECLIAEVEVVDTELTEFLSGQSPSAYAESIYT